MYLQSLRLQDFKSFRDASIDFRAPTDDPGDPTLFQNVTLLLGDNGSGKSTVLRAAAIALVGDLLSNSGFVPTTLVRRGARPKAKFAALDAHVSLHWHDTGASKPNEVAQSAKLQARIDVYGVREELHVEPDKMNVRLLRAARSSEYSRLVFGYSASRRVESPDSFDSASRRKRGVFYARIASLFEEQYSLTPLASWLPRFETQNPGRAKQVKSLLNTLLPDDCEFTGRLTQDDYGFRHRGVLLPFAALSDGYRGYVGWIADLLFHLAMSCPPGVKLTEGRSVVLVDEIDVHLHPSWQREVLPLLARALPRVQFIVTTHSPIVAGSLQRWNVLRIDRDEAGASVVVRPMSALHGLSSEQVLLSPYFDMESTRSPDAVLSLQARALRAADGDVTAAREFVEQLQGTLIPEIAERSPRPSVTRNDVKQHSAKTPRQSQKKPTLRVVGTAAKATKPGRRRRA